MNARLLLLALTGWLTAGDCRADTDTGSAHNLIVKKDLSGDWYLASRNLLTTVNGFDDLFFGYVDLNLGYDLGGGWAVEAGYRHAWLDIGEEWREEYRPSAILSYRTMLGDWSFANRHRLEFRTFEDDLAPERFRYRNETRLVAPWEFTSLNAKPFLEEEFFYEFTDDGFNFNWLTTGLRWPVCDGVVAKLGYRWQASRFGGGDWNHRHQLVTGLLFFF
ncbi:MAG: DUF2490 domain-containing protein [Akkermansiaceae bacterium]|nr:DUF2490 domain-containing protein [Akkermansiaceae bacterium]NNM30327.1 DUF2490 domain-containing protein [Akkermansiaceae bacterium]